jgi:opacity protein-like surface antigen
MHTVDDLRTMIASNQTQISSVLSQAGLGDLTTPFMNVVATGYVSDTTVAPGTHMDWMALKRAGRGSVLHNVRWTGAQAFDAFQFSVEYAGYSYTFVVPKICGNFALLSRAPVPVAAAPPPPPPAPEPPPVVQAPPPPPAPVVEAERLYPWMVTGFLGSQFSTGTSHFLPNLGVVTLSGVEFGPNTADGGLTYGLQIGYLRKYFGGEFIGDFAPNFRMSSLALAKDPTLNSWMFNFIGSYPVANAFEPYASIGIGGITLRTQTFDETAIPVITVQGTLETAQNTINTSQTAFGWNVGGGFFAYANRWGIRADARWYDATNSSTSSLLRNGVNVPANYTQALLSGLSYWRANLGLSYRW